MFVNPYESYEDYLKLAEIDTLELLISNTTESGIVLDENDSIDATPPKTFPGKVLAFPISSLSNFQWRSIKRIIYCSMRVN